MMDINWDKKVTAKSWNEVLEVLQKIGPKLTTTKEYWIRMIYGEKKKGDLLLLFLYFSTEYWSTIPVFGYFRITNALYLIHKMDDDEISELLPLYLLMSQVQKPRLSC